jgi:cell division protein ZapA (FtsZ GTPase activity inhibitor)
MLEKKAQGCKVRILDEEYSLVTSESEQHIREAAHLVDSLLREIMQAAAARTDDKKIAIVAALRIASRALKSEDELRTLKEKQTALSVSIGQELQRHFSGNS